jgi:hypothetical protein
MQAALVHTVQTQTVQTHNVKTPGTHSSTLSWLLLAVWLAYSAAMLWHIKVNSAGATAMCHYVEPK